MYIISGNYGDNTVALIQWAYENKLSNLMVSHVETGWAAPNWGDRVSKGQALAKRYGFNAISIKAKASFQDLAEDRHAFPNQKFEWCAGFLKGLPFIEWADTIDDACEATVLLGSRRADSRARVNLPEFIKESEHHGDRRVWYPLYKHSDEERDALIKRADFDLLGHRSLECDPCIHSKAADFCRLDTKTIVCLKRLEKELDKPMFDPRNHDGAKGIEAVVTWAKKQKKTRKYKSLEFFDMGCGAPFGCGE